MRTSTDGPPVGGISGMVFWRPAGNRRPRGVRGAYAPPRTRRAPRAPAALLLFIALIVAWEIVVRAAHVKAFVVPPPSAVIHQLLAHPGLYFSATLSTIAEALGGLLLAVAAAFVFAVAAQHSRLLDRMLTPLVVVSQTIPVITLAPLLVLWFGYGATPRVVVCALVAFFPLAVNARDGLRATDPDLLLLLRSVDASQWDVFWKVRLPQAGPFLVAGIRTGVTLSLVGAVVAEWTGAGRGLGYLVLSANSRLATAQAFAAVLIICLLGLAAYGGVGLLESRIGWWKRNSPETERTSS